MSEIVNFDDIINKGKKIPKMKQKHPMIPTNRYYCILNAPSGSGKTNLLMNILFNYLSSYDTLTIICPTYEEKYDYLEEFFTKMQLKLDEKCAKNKCEPYQIFRRITDMKAVPDINTYDPHKRNCVIWDDIIAMPKKWKEEVVGPYFIAGRHSGICYQFLLSQAFFQIPNVIRKQCNGLMTFRDPDDRSINQMYQIFGTELPKKEFKKLYLDCTKKKYNFLCINMEHDFDCGRYCKNLDEVYIPMCLFKVDE